MAAVKPLKISRAVTYARTFPNDSEATQRETGIRHGKM